ncbi:uncharacterized protein LOC133885757 [Phragmites australis]|uniref:uncharacterized protein LOC133885757 n=1 Tax=Phragmites australis TaxID=29695 RepID=UPI002D79B822|nr:uncharacterized protein LOC133885757 [Phragmites australis]
MGPASSAFLYILGAPACMSARNKLLSPLWIPITRTRNSMGQGAAKAKQGGEQDQTLRTDKDKNSAHRSRDADELIEFMKGHYKDKVQHVKTFDDFYHAIYELIQMFCESRGQLQYKIPSREELEIQYLKAHPSGDANLTEKQFLEIAKGIVKLDSFTFGKATWDIIVVLFGLPVCALLTKTYIPGLKSISDDIVIPAATSGAVVYLAKTNKL